MFQNNQRPQFHFSCPKGWLNDPNGFSFFKNEFHLFFQYNPFDTKWGPMHWGHATSKNLLEWNIQKTALFPDSNFDNQGCFSGTALEENGRHILMYTGVTRSPENPDETIQQQCIAAGDGKTYSKLPENPVIKSDDVKTEFIKTDFRDPKIWKDGETYFCIAVIKKPDGNGAAALFSSADITNWHFETTLAQTNGELGGMWECPDLFNLENRDVLIVSPQEMKADAQKGFHDGNNSVYITGTFDKDALTFQKDIRPENNFYAAELDYGIDFYAPQTMQSPDGRRILIAWMQAWESYITPKNFSWSGMMTLPRELFFKDNCLFQRPVKEYEERIKKLPFLSGKICKNLFASFDKKNYPQFELDITCTLEKSKSENSADGNFSVKIFDNKNQFVLFTFDAASMELRFDRSKSIDGGGAVNSRAVKIPAQKNGSVSFRFIADTYSCETFINGGQVVFTNAFFLHKNVRKIRIDTTLTNGVLFKLIKL